MRLSIFKFQILRGRSGNNRGRASFVQRKFNSWTIFYCDFNYRGCFDMGNKQIKGEIMALETLEGVKEIGGFEIANMGDLAKEFPQHFEESGQMNWKWFEKEIRPNKFIYVRPDVNSLTFNIQNGPIKENGVNGCQVDTLIHAARKIILELDRKYPSNYNKDCMGHLTLAIEALEQRPRSSKRGGD